MNKIKSYSYSYSYSYKSPSFQGKEKFVRSLTKQDPISSSKKVSSRNILKTYANIKNFITNIFSPSTSYLAKKASKIVTDDRELQLALKQMIMNEAIIIRTKEDAIPIIKKQYLNIQNQNPNSEIFVLNINPQKNRGLPKSNTLISNWFVEENNLQKKFITEPVFEDIYNKIERLKGINKNKHSDSIKFQDTIEALNLFDMNNFEKSIEVLKKKFGNLDIISKKGQELFGSKKKAKNYAQRTAILLREAINKKNTTIVIPDDCSLSGASMLCDTVKILDYVYDGSVDSQTKTKFVFSPLILGTKAKRNIEKFIDKNVELDDDFYKEVCATDELKSAFKKIKQLIKEDKIEFEIAKPYKEAKHFNQTETFENIGRRNPQLQEKLYDIMRCPDGNLENIYEGFNNCGVMVITPTETFKLNGKTYAGKIPTNCVGFMEVVGITMGVLNDAYNPLIKGIFNKGTGRGYLHYSQKENLLHPRILVEPIRISVNQETGAVEPSDVVQKYYKRKFKNYVSKIFSLFNKKEID